VKRTVAILCWLVSVFFLVGSTSADDQGDVATLLKVDRDFYQASLAKGAEAFAEYAAETATEDEGETVFRGRSEILEAFKKAFAQPGFKLAWDPDDAFVAGGLGITHGHYELHEKAADGTDKKIVGQYVTVWRKQKDGSWKFVWDGANGGD
jgi:ketosteroid isomerase-like protein